MNWCFQRNRKRTYRRPPIARCMRRDNRRRYVCEYCGAVSRKREAKIQHRRFVVLKPNLWIVPHPALW